MAKEPGVWGIDLGQCALKALRLEKQADQVVATAFDYVEHPKILSQPDADPDQLVREALDKFLARNTLRGDLVAISVPGQSGLARFVKLPPVEEKKIGDIVRFEAKQQIPFNLDEVVWDYQKIGSGMVTDGFAMDTEIGLFAIKRDLINTNLQHFKDVNVEVHFVQMAPLALCNFVTYELLAKPAGGDGEAPAGGKKSCVVALDIGADSSNLVITDGQRIIWQRHVPLGGNHFTRALTKDLKLTFAKAEHLKRNATKSVDKNIDLKKILAALKPVLNDFVGEVQRSLGYFSNTHRDAHIEYMVGLGNAFRLPGLQRFLGEKLQLEVRKLTKFEHLSGDSVLAQPTFADNLTSFSVAYGLALQGLGAARLQTNLLPPEIRVDRLIRGKKPWAAAAAAALLLGTFGLTLGYAMDYRAFGAPKVVDAIKVATKDPGGAVDKAKKGKASYDAEQKKVEDEERAVKSIVAGTEERLNWVQLNWYLNWCIPQPNQWPPPPQVGNMQWNGKFKYWDGAKDAYEKYLARMTGANKPAADDKNAKPEDPDAGIENLIQVNVETIDARYTEDLAAYWTALKATKNFANDILPNIRPEEDSKEDKAPQGKGWVVELRGYTFHQAKSNFIVSSLVENLAHYGTKRAAAPAGDAGNAGGAAKPAAEGADQKPSTSEGPVVNNVSHVLLYTADERGNGSLLNTSVLAGLVKSAPAAGGDTGGQGAMPSMTGGTGGSPAGGAPGAGGGGKGRDGWTPLGGPAGSGGGNPGFGGGSPAPGAMMPVPATGGAEAAARPQHPRTEFVVLFIWKEPTPSDDLVHLNEDTGPASGGGPGGGMTGMPGGTGGPGGGMPGGSVPSAK